MENYNIKSFIANKPRIGLLFSKLDLLLPWPLFLLFHITLSCNRKCVWCYQNADKFYSLQNSDYMDIAAYEKILRDFDFFKPHIHLYGGEPLLHPDFPSFLEYSRKYNYKPTITTNGDFLDKYSECIIKSSLTQLNISINGLITCNGCIDHNLENNIRRFININKDKKIINFNYVINHASLCYLKDIILFLNREFKKGDFSYFVIQHLSGGIHFYGENMLSLNFNEIIGLLNCISKMRLKFKIIFMPPIKIRDIRTYYATQFKFKNQCCVPWFGLSIYPDLTVTPGGGILGCNFPLGNLSKTSIKDIWRNLEFKNFRLRLVRGGLLENCNRCCHKFYY